MSSIMTPRGAIPTPLHPGVLLQQHVDYASRTVLGAAPTPQVDTITLSGTSASEVTVTATVGRTERSVSVTFAGSVDATNTDALLAALQADPVFAGLFSAVTKATSTTLTLQGFGPATFSVAVSGTGISVATTQAAEDSPSLAYGRVYPIGARTTTGEMVATQAGSRTELSGPVITLACTHSGTEDYDIAGTLQGPDGRLLPVAETGSVGADLDAMLAAIDAALTGLVPGATVDSDTSPNVVWSLPVGWSIVSLSTSASGSADVAATTVAGDDAPDLAGVALNQLNDEFADFSGTYVTSRRADQGVALVTAGAGISVPLADGVTVSDGDPVWVETATGSYGICHPTPSPTRYLLTGAAFIAPSSDALGVVGV